MKKLNKSQIKKNEYRIKWQNASQNNRSSWLHVHVFASQVFSVQSGERSNDSLPGNFFELVLKLLCKNNEQLFIWFHHGRNSIIVEVKHIQFLRYELHLVILIFFTFSHSVAEYEKFTKVHILYTDSNIVKQDLYSTRNSSKIFWELSSN